VLKHLGSLLVESSIDVGESGTGAGLLEGIVWLLLRWIGILA